MGRAFITLAEMGRRRERVSKAHAGGLRYTGEPPGARGLDAKEMPNEMARSRARFGIGEGIGAAALVVLALGGLPSVGLGQDTGDAPTEVETAPSEPASEPQNETAPETPPPNDGEEVRVHLRLARVYFDSGRFEAAAQEFQYAYDLSDDPAILHDLYLAWRNAGNVDRAIEALELYLERVPDVPDRPQLEARLANLRRLKEQQDLARAENREPPELEPPPPEERPAPTPEPPSPGTTPPPPPPVAPEPLGVRLAPWLVMGAGGALLVGAIATGLYALRAETKLENRCAPAENGSYVCAYPGFRDDLQRGESLATATDVLIITGGIFVAAGLALLFLLDQPGRGEAPILNGFQANAGCSTTGCAAFVGRSF